jgi:hypothetical protein
MSTNNENRDFAFGRNVWEGCKCPALQAGFEPGAGGDVTYIAEMYDGIVREHREASKGVVREETAKAAWERMIKRLERHKEEEAEFARDIAYQLGWSDL